MEAPRTKAGQAVNMILRDWAEWYDYWYDSLIEAWLAVLPDDEGEAIYKRIYKVNSKGKPYYADPVDERFDVFVEKAEDSRQFPYEVEPDYETDD